MDEILIFWMLKRYGASRGYKMSKKEWKELIPYSEKEMQKLFEKWLEDSKRVEEVSEHLIN